MARRRRVSLAVRLLVLAAAAALTVWAALPAALGSSGGKSSAASAYGKAYGLQRVAVCHKGHHTIHIALPAVPAHLAHGDTLGSCD